MARFNLVHLVRSDGKIVVVSDSGRQENNRPTDEQLQQPADTRIALNYYAELSNDDDKVIDWRKKLAGMLMRDLGRPG